MRMRRECSLWKSCLLLIIFQGWASRCKEGDILVDYLSEKRVCSISVCCHCC